MALIVSKRRMPEPNISGESDSDVSANSPTSSRFQPKPLKRLYAPSEPNERPVVSVSGSLEKLRAAFPSQDDKAGPRTNSLPVGT